MANTMTPLTSTNGSIDARTLTNFDVLDIGVLVGYFILIVAIGLLSMLKKNHGSISGYFLAGRYITWMPVGASLFASNIGSQHFIGLAGSGAASGISVGSFEINALFILQLSGWIFLPVFIGSRVSTLPEYMFKRFGGRRIRTYLAVLSLVLYVFTKISVNLFSAAIFIQQALPWTLYQAVGIVVLVSAVCTLAGGLTAVIYTDTVQFLLIIVGSGYVAGKAFEKIGGYEGLREKYASSIPSVRLNDSDCGIPSEDSWSMLRSIDDPYLPWLGFILGQTPASIWYWCTDQIMIQRLLAAKSLSHAQGGTLFAGFMKILPLFFIVMPGMISRVLYTDEVACVDPQECFKYCQNEAGCSNTAYPRLVLDIMPSGFRGMMMAVMLAALVTDLTSVYNSASTLFAMDIWPQMRKDPSAKEVVRIGRIFIVFMVIVSIAWIPVIQSNQGGQLFIYIQVVSAYLSPPIAAVYISAIMWTRMNEKGAFWSLMLGLAVGSTRMILDFVYIEPHCGQIDDRPDIVKNVHFLYFACILFWLTLFAGIIISFKTEEPEEFRLIRTTYWTRMDQKERKDDLKSMEMKTVDCENHQEQLTQEVETSLTYELEEGTQAKEERKSVLEKCKYFISFGKSKKSQGDHERNEKEFFEHLIRAYSLEQTKFQKVILYTCLALDLTIAVSIFIYFSI